MPGTPSTAAAVLTASMSVGTSRRNVPPTPARAFIAGFAVGCSFSGAWPERPSDVCGNPASTGAGPASPVDGPLAAQRISGAVFSQIEPMESFDPAFLELIRDEARRHTLAKTTRLQELDLLIDQRQREIQNLMKFIRGGGESPSVQTELRKLESELDGNAELRRKNSRTTRTIPW